MNWTALIIIAAVVLGFLVLKRATFVSAEAARKHLAAGGLVIDVRSPEEFRAGQVANAINIPLGELRERVPQVVKDRQQPLLVHCLSGGRSAVARQQLKSLGYQNVFNLGSFARARKIVGSGL